MPQRSLVAAASLLFARISYFSEQYFSSMVVPFRWQMLIRLWRGQARQLGPCSNWGSPGLHLGNAFFSGCCPHAALGLSWRVEFPLVESLLFALATQGCWPAFPWPHSRAGAGFPLQWAVCNCGGCYTDFIRNLKIFP